MIAVFTEFTTSKCQHAQAKQALPMRPTHHVNFIFILLLAIVLFAQNSFANDYTQWGLPAGAKARLGKGRILEIAYSPVGDRFAIATPIGVWIYDAKSGVEVMFLAGDKTESTLLPSMNRVTSVAFSPDGRTIASGSFDHIRLWDVHTGNQTGTFGGEFQTQFFTSVAFSPDGDTIASGSTDGKILIWDVHTGQILGTFEGKTDSSYFIASIASVVFSPDGGTLASTSRDDNTIQLWNVHAGEHMHTLFGHTEVVNSIAFSSDGHMLASGSNDNTIRLWSVLTGEHKQTVSEHNTDVTSVAFSPDGSTLASAGYTTILLRNLRSEEDQKIYLWPVERIQSIAFSPSGCTLVSGDYNGRVHQWDVDTKTQMQTIEGHTPSVSSIAFNPQGFMLASGSSQVKTLRLWDTSSNRRNPRLVDGYWGPVTSLLFSSDGSTIATSSDSLNHAIILLNQHVSRNESRIERELDRYRTGKGSQDESEHAPDPLGIWLWDVSTGERTLSLRDRSHGAECMAFSPDGSMLASAQAAPGEGRASLDYLVHVWDVRTGDKVKTFEGHVAEVNCVEFSPDGTLLASGSENGTIRFWDADTGQQLETYKGHTDAVNSIAFSPDGKTLASGSGKWGRWKDTTIRLWDVPSDRHRRNGGGGTWQRLARLFGLGKASEVLKGHGRGVNAVAFSPDGEIIASGSSDSTIRLWNPHNGMHLKTLEGHKENVNSIAFSPDGRTLASGSEDGTILLWNLSDKE